MSERKFTLGEANELLPYLAPALVELREKAEGAARLGREIEARASAGNGIAELKAAQARVMERVEELLARVDEWGVLLRDVSSGLVDFPATTGDEEILYCWRLGEPEVAHWHSASDGFLGRRSILEL